MWAPNLQLASTRILLNLKISEMALPCVMSATSIDESITCVIGIAKELWRIVYIVLVFMLLEINQSIINESWD